MGLYKWIIKDGSTRCAPYSSIFRDELTVSRTVLSAKTMRRLFSESAWTRSRHRLNGQKSIEIGKCTLPYGKRHFCAVSIL